MTADLYYGCVLFDINSLNISESESENFLISDEIAYKNIINTV